MADWTVETYYEPEHISIENGRGNPTLKTLARLAAALGQKLVLQPD